MIIIDIMRHYQKAMKDSGLKEARVVMLQQAGFGRATEAENVVLDNMDALKPFAGAELDNAENVRVGLIQGAVRIGILDRNLELKITGEKADTFATLYDKERERSADARSVAVHIFLRLYGPDITRQNYLNLRSQREIGDEEAEKAGKARRMNVSGAVGALVGMGDVDVKNSILRDMAAIGATDEAMELSKGEGLRERRAKLETGVEKDREVVEGDKNLLDSIRADVTDIKRHLKSVYWRSNVHEIVEGSNNFLVLLCDYREFLLNEDHLAHDDRHVQEISDLILEFDGLLKDDGLNLRQWNDFFASDLMRRVGDSMDFGNYNKERDFLTQKRELENLESAGLVNVRHLKPEEYTFGVESDAKQIFRVFQRSVSDLKQYQPWPDSLTARIEEFGKYVVTLATDLSDDDPDKPHYSELVAYFAHTYQPLIEDVADFLADKVRGMSAGIAQKGEEMARIDADLGNLAEYSGNPLVDALKKAKAVLVEVAEKDRDEAKFEVDKLLAEFKKMERQLSAIEEVEGVVGDTVGDEELKKIKTSLEVFERKGDLDSLLELETALNAAEVNLREARSEGTTNTGKIEAAMSIYKNELESRTRQFNFCKSGEAHYHDVMEGIVNKSKTKMDQVEARYRLNLSAIKLPDTEEWLKLYHNLSLKALSSSESSRMLERLNSAFDQSNPDDEIQHMYALMGRKILGLEDQMTRDLINQAKEIALKDIATDTPLYEMIMRAAKVLESEIVGDLDPVNTSELVKKIDNGFTAKQELDVLEESFATLNGEFEEVKAGRAVDRFLLSAVLGKLSEYFEATTLNPDMSSRQRIHKLTSKLKAAARDGFSDVTQAQEFLSQNSSEIEAVIILCIQAADDLVSLEVGRSERLISQKESLATVAQDALTAKCLQLKGELLQDFGPLKNQLTSSLKEMKPDKEKAEEVYAIKSKKLRNVSAQPLEVIMLQQAGYPVEFDDDGNVRIWGYELGDLQDDDTRKGILEELKKMRDGLTVQRGNNFVTITGPGGQLKGLIAELKKDRKLGMPEIEAQINQDSLRGCAVSIGAYIKTEMAKLSKFKSEDADISKKLGVLEGMQENLKKTEEEAKKLYDELGKLFGNFDLAEQIGLTAHLPDGYLALKTTYNSLVAGNFTLGDVENLHSLYQQMIPYLEDKGATAKLVKGVNITRMQMETVGKADSVHEGIRGAMVRLIYPDLSPVEQMKLATDSVKVDRALNSLDDGNEWAEALTAKKLDALQVKAFEKFYERMDIQRGGAFVAFKKVVANPKMIERPESLRTLMKNPAIGYEVWAALYVAFQEVGGGAMPLQCAIIAEEMERKILEEKGSRPSKPKLSEHQRVKKAKALVKELIAEQEMGGVVTFFTNFDSETGDRRKKKARRLEIKKRLAVLKTEDPGYNKRQFIDEITNIKASNDDEEIKFDPPVDFFAHRRAKLEAFGVERVEEHAWATGEALVRETPKAAIRWGLGLPLGIVNKVFGTNLALPGFISDFVASNVKESYGKGLERAKKHHSHEVEKANLESELADLDEELKKDEERVQIAKSGINIKDFFMADLDDLPDAAAA